MGDLDRDGLLDRHEMALGTSPWIADTDGDGVTDGLEIACRTSPWNATDLPAPGMVDNEVGIFARGDDGSTVLTLVIATCDGDLEARQVGLELLRPGSNVLSASRLLGSAMVRTDEVSAGCYVSAVEVRIPELYVRNFGGLAAGATVGPGNGAPIQSRATLDLAVRQTPSQKVVMFRRKANLIPPASLTSPQQPWVGPVHPPADPRHRRRQRSPADVALGQGLLPAARDGRRERQRLHDHQGGGRGLLRRELELLVRRRLPRHRRSDHRGPRSWRPDRRLTAQAGPMAAAEASEDPDLQLVVACQAAPEEGFDGPFRALYEAYRDRGLQHLLPDHGNATDALDAAQETFVLVHRRIGGFRRESRLSSWIYRIAVNASIDLKRRSTSRPWTSLEALRSDPDRGLDPEDDAQPDPPGPWGAESSPRMSKPRSAGSATSSRWSSSCATCRSSATTRSPRPWGSPGDGQIASLSCTRGP